jgi:ankyrin repeat protein
VKQVRHYKIDIHEMFERRVKLSKAYQYHNSREFFSLVKEGSVEVEKMLKDNPMLAYDHDEQNLTALHWAAKEGFQNIVRMLIQDFHSNFDARDCYGRTPLHVAVTHQRVECIYRLVIEGAKTNIMDYQRKFIKEVAPNVYIKYILEKL